MTTEITIGDGTDETGGTYHPELKVTSHDPEPERLTLTSRKENVLPFRFEKVDDD